MRQPRVENRKPRTESRKPRTDNQESKTESRKPKTDNRKPNLFSVLRSRFSVLGSRFSVLGFLFSVLCFLFSSPLPAKNLIPSLSSKSSPNWKIPSVIQYTLPNGLKLYLLPDHTFPLFKLKLFVKAGSVDEDLSKKGLADLTATLLATGGTKDKTPEEMDAWLEERAIHLSADADRELSTVTVSSLAAQEKEALAFFKEVILNPRFDDDRFRLAQSQYRESLRKAMDHPHSVLARNFREFIYGKESRFGKQTSFKTLAKIKREDLLSFHQKYFQPSRMVVAVAGDFSLFDLKKWFEENFGPLPAGDVRETEVEVLPFETPPGKKIIKKKLTQAFIEVGQLGLTRHDKEKYPYSLLQYILGGDVFTSRLGKEIRTELGLAYSVYSEWEADPWRGFFKIHVETRAETKDQVLKKIVEHLRRVHEQADITEEELTRAKEALLNQYIFWFDSSFDTVEAKAKLDLLGYEPDYLQKYPERISAVTLEEIKKMAKEMIQPEGLKIVIVGP